MKKKILSFILATLLIILSLPLSAFANEIANVIDENAPPVVSVSSLHYYEETSYRITYPNEFRALPDEEGYFYLDISLDKAPNDNSNVVVYYRTVDDSAVAQWGDYEDVGHDAFVTLSASNGYKARVIIKSKILDEAFYTTDRDGNENKDKIISRRFLFELTDVDGDATLDSESSIYCYLRASGYFYQENDATPNTNLEEKFNTLWHMQDDMKYHSSYPSLVKEKDEYLGNVPYFSEIYNVPWNCEPRTPPIMYKGSYSDSINMGFSDEFRDYLNTGWVDLGISINGKIVRDLWDSDGAATFHLYYTYGGQTKIALSLYLEGEFDDCEYMGWEYAYEYLFEDPKVAERDEETWKEFKDHVQDNFIGFTLYDNDENVLFEVKMGEDRDSYDIDAVRNALKSTLTGGSAVKYANLFEAWPWDYRDDDADAYYYYLILPSNFAFADSYSYEFISDSTDVDEIRWIEDCNITFALIANGQPEFLEDERETQMVSTNLGTIKEGDPLRMSIRFDRPVHVSTPNGNCYITVDLYNEKTLVAENVRLNLKQLEGSSKSSSYTHFAWDTLVFESEKPLLDIVDNVRIYSIRNIRLDDGSTAESNPTDGIRAYFTNANLWSKRIDDIYGLNADLRVPVAGIGITPSDNWVKARSFDIYVNTQENSASRFGDYVTVYYQWSNSKALPETYSSKVVFNVKDDGEALKSVIGTGNGEMYLHMKAVSSYGHSSISDALTGTYDPTDPSAVYTPFGIFKFDNAAPTLSVDDITVSGSLKDRTVSIPLPDDAGCSGLQYISLYYVAKNSENGEGTLLKKFTADNFSGDPKRLQYTISHKDVGVGVDVDGNLTLERREVKFYWIISDKLGNTTDKAAAFSIVFDTNDYISSEITKVSPYDLSSDTARPQFEENTQQIDENTFVYDFSPNEGKTPSVWSGNNKKVYYGFYFKLDKTAFGSTDNGVYSAKISYKGEQITDFSIHKADGAYIVWFHCEMAAGRYDVQLTRTEGTSTRVSRVYSIYATDGEQDATAVKNRIESGTLLSNTVYQLSTEYPYFYYKDAEGNRQQEYYNGTKQPATFSSFAKAKEYVYYKELSDIYLVQLTAATASALNSGTAGYLIAKGETVTPKAGQYWIRYKSEAWTPTSGDSSWVYYYYGMSDVLAEGALSLNLQLAINTVANRIAGYGKTVVLTDSSIFLGTTMTEKMLDKYGMPYLLDGQIHSVDEMSNKTMCENVWSMQVCYAGDKNIYKSKVFVGTAGTADYAEYPIVGNFALPEDSRFLYMTYEEHGKQDAEWRVLNIRPGETFIDVLTASGVYYLREMSADGVATYAIYVDKEAPVVSFLNKDDEGNFKEIPVDGNEITDIRTSELYIGSISATEHDRLSYVAVYKVSNLSLVSVYTAPDLDGTPIKLEDGNYYIVVADRSGNSYTITAKVSSSDLDCVIKESTDRFIRLTCNRKADQIIRYEVYLNGELVTSTYSPDQTFDKAGLYSIYVQDIYGNVYTEEYRFNRNYPAVTWKYLGADGKYHVYDPETPNSDGFIMNGVSDNQYKISTSVKTRFRFSADYVFEFIGAQPTYTQTVGAETSVTIEAGQSFTLKVSYKNHPDSYTVYSGVVDVTPPSISVNAEVDVLANGEYVLFDEWIESGKVELDDIYYLLSEIGNRTVTNGGTVSSDLIRINAGDANGLSLIEVYLDGILINSQDASSEFPEMIVSRWGSYRIVAKDALGNVSEFNFTNGMPDDLGYFVDGDKKELELHGYLNFEAVDGKHVYTKVDHGNTDLRLDIRKNADVFMSVAVSGGTAEIYGFRISDGQIYSLTYTITPDKNGNNTVSLTAGAPLIDINSGAFKFNSEYAIAKTDSYTVYASINADKVVSIKVYAPTDTSGVTFVNARVDFANSFQTFVSAELSKRFANVAFKELDVQGGTDIRANNGFTVDESCFGAERIAGVRLYYSNLNDLDVNKLDGRVDIYTPGKKYSEEGFYLLVVRNLYGNEVAYRISVSKSAGVTSSVTFADGHKIYYSKDYTGVLYSNSKITLDLFDVDLKYSVTRNGEECVDFARIMEGDVAYLVFSKDGSYVVTLTDSYGTQLIKRLEIRNSTFAVSDDLLTGYNDKALKRDEGYTNQMLTVDKAVYDRDSLYYLAISYRDSLTVLFDAFAETPVFTDANDLVNVIGSMGDGVYTVICRDRYGSLVTKTVNYRGTPTLKLERTTRSKTESEVYELDKAILIGFWSNNTLKFITDANTYIFTVNGVATECPRTLVFENAGDFGSFEYDITYIDEYGFEYSFKAYLVRKSVAVSLPSTVTGIDVNGILNTKSDISVTFSENAYATYTINNGEPVTYYSGNVLKKDGIYRFTVVDYAGNVATLTVKKDTVAEYSFVQYATGAIVQNGSVVNSSKVVFDSINKDSSYIEQVIKDGVLLTDYTDTKFTEDGKWEFIISDKLGNRSYFCFYIVTHAQNGFSYTTPYEYRITEMWYDSGDGVRISFMNYVEHIGNSSKFNFIENGKYTVVMTSDVTGATTTFDFTVNTNAPDVSLVGCNRGDTTINDVTLSGYKVGDRIKVYKITDRGQELVEEVVVTSSATKAPTVTEGGKYRIVVESEAGVQTELTFVRKHVMNTAGSVFIMVVIAISVIGLFTGLVYRNKSKTDD